MIIIYLEGEWQIITTIAFQIKEIEIPFRAKYSSHVFHQYTIKLKDKREEFITYLSNLNIPV